MLRKKLKAIHSKIPPSFTIMFIPHSEQSVFRAKVPRLVIQGSLVLLIGLIISTYYFYTDYHKMKTNMSELYRLETVNKEQEFHLRELETKTEQLQEKIPELNQLENNVRNMLEENDRPGREDLPSRSDALLSRNSIRVSQTNEPTANHLMPSSAAAYGGTGNFTAIPVDNSIDEGADWDTRYSEINSTLENLLAQYDNSKQTLIALNGELETTIEYLAAKPYGWPTTEQRITSRYGWRRSPFTSRREFHDGLDIAAPYGSPVEATHNGTVVYVGYTWIYGRTVMIENKKYGFKTFYSHNSKILVEVGDEVSRGDIIAKIGSTGRSTGPHTHYEVQVNGVRVNPADYLQ